MVTHWSHIFLNLCFARLACTACKCRRRVTESRQRLDGLQLLLQSSPLHTRVMFSYHLHDSMSPNLQHQLQEFRLTQCSTCSHVRQRSLVCSSHVELPGSGSAGLECFPIQFLPNLQGSFLQCSFSGSCSSASRNTNGVFGDCSFGSRTVRNSAASERI